MGGSLTELEVGSQLEPYVVPSVDPTRIKLASALLDDPNPIHFDVGAVRRLGLGEALVNHGPINLAYLINTAMQVAPVGARLRGFRGRFVGNVFAGERVECTATVAEVDAEHGLLRLELNAAVGDRKVMTGEAVLGI